MLYRTLGEKRISITQPTHAWVSGQMAQVWGNERFGSITPYAAVCLAVEQHDIGWLPWESSPTFNPNTGYPHSFAELAPEVHTQLWAGAKQFVMPMGRYAALLVSRHGTGLYERFTYWKKSPESTRVVEAFLQQEREFQQQLIQQLEQDPAYQAYVTPEAIAKNQQLIVTLDALSLIICKGITQPQQVEQVPTATAETTLTLMPIDHDPTQISVDPWCFQPHEVTVVFEGRIFKEQAHSEQMMREQLATAPSVTLTATLRPRSR